MLCVFVELGISEEGDGIMELLSDVLIGIDLCEYLSLDDNIIDVDLILNCGDCLGIKGLVCEVGVLNSIDVNNFEIVFVVVMIEDKVFIEFVNDDVCFCYLGCVIKGINFDVEILFWMVEKFCCSGICLIDLVVDVINYVLLEFGYLMYVFDLNVIEGGIKVCSVNVGEEIVFFDGNIVKLNEFIFVIVDYNKVFVIVGIFGGEKLGVIELMLDILLESVFFNLVVIVG